MAISVEPEMTTQTIVVDGLTLRYAEAGQGQSTHAILTSPWPESLFSFEPMWERLAEHAHVIAVDLPGFGHSEYRAELQTSRAMGDFILTIADAFGLEAFHGVGPDIGTSSFLFAAAQAPQRIQSLVIGSGCAAFPIQAGGELADVIFAPDIRIFDGFEPREVIGAILGYHERHVLPERVREDFLSAYDGDRFVPSLGFVRAYPQELPVLAETLGSIQTPVAILQGAHDPGVLPVNAEYLRDGLPHSRLTLLDAGHFPWADRADEYAALILNWWSGAYLNP
jgi:pimeloyl-ACP methyl ester carboxylesterase